MGMGCGTGVEAAATATGGGSDDDSEAVAPLWWWRRGSDDGESGDLGRAAMRWRCTFTATCKEVVIIPSGDWWHSLALPSLHCRPTRARHVES